MPACRRIDLNADLGESFGAWTMGDDEAMLDVVTSANVACGFHAGDPVTMAATCRAAVQRGVAIGAHIAYADLAGFGRRFVDVDPVELRAATLAQIGALDALARAAGGAVRYVKPHGALYHAMTTHPPQAHAVAEAIDQWHGDPLAVVIDAGSALADIARRRGLHVVIEAFADRAYTADGRLAPRGTAGAVLHDPAAVAGQAVRLAVSGEVETVDGGTVAIDATTICLHGDTPGAVDNARAVRAALTDAGVDVVAFSR